MKKFMMSKRFNKTSCSDFGLYEKGGKYYSKCDGSEWEPCSLYDFGWGRENGFFKVPLGDFSDLIKIVLDYSDEEDSYAAASIIIDIYASELKIFLLDLINSHNVSIDYDRLRSHFQLDVPQNRTFKVGMDLQEIEKEYADWKNISKYFQNINKSHIRRKKWWNPM